MYTIIPSCHHCSGLESTHRGKKGRHEKEKKGREREKRERERERETHHKAKAMPG